MAGWGGGWGALVLFLSRRTPPHLSKNNFDQTSCAMFDAELQGRIEVACLEDVNINMSSDDTTHNILPFAEMNVCCNFPLSDFQNIADVPCWNSRESSSLLEIGFSAQRAYANGRFGKANKMTEFPTREN